MASLIRAKYAVCLVSLKVSVSFWVQQMYNNFDEMFVIAWTDSCHVDKFLQSKRRKLREDDISFSGFQIILCLIVWYSG